MKAHDIRTALIDACKAQCVSLGITLIRPNMEFPAPMPLPRIEFDFSGVRRQNSLLKGGHVDLETGFFSPALATEKGVKDADALEYADAIVALFPSGHAIAIDGGKIEITVVPTIRNGFPDKTSWRIPLSIPYRADATT